MEMQKSNYQIMQGQMAERFLQYNQEQMTEKFSFPVMKIIFMLLL